MVATSQTKVAVVVAGQVCTARKAVEEEAQKRMVQWKVVSSLVQNVSGKLSVVPLWVERAV